MIESIMTFSVALGAAIVASAIFSLIANAFIEVTRKICCRQRR
jgi:hypothetical protein